MLLRHLASSPATPATALGHLLDHALTSRPATTAGGWQPRHTNNELRCALVSNPAVPLAHVHQLTAGIPLVEGRRQILRAALSRPGLDVPDALALLGGDHSAGALLEALELVADPDGHLAEHVSTHGSGTQIWDALLTHPSTAPATRWQVATALATCGKRLSAKHCAHLAHAVRDRLAWARTPAEHHDALVWADALTADPAKADARLVSRLAGISRTFIATATGSPAWLTSPGTPLPEVIAWARTHGAPAFITALKGRRDPHAHLATAAQGAHPADPALARVLTGARFPATIRQRAARTLRLAGCPLSSAVSAELCRGGDPGQAVALFTVDPTRYGLSFLMRREDLTSAHLDQLLDLDLAQHGVSVHEQALWLGTYPTATREQRRRAAGMVRGASEADYARSNATPLLDALLDHLDRIDPDDPATLVAAVADLDVSTPGHALAAAPGVAWLLRSALAAQLPADFTSDAARVLALLAQDFHGTVRELFDTALTVVAPGAY